MRRKTVLGTTKKKIGTFRQGYPSLILCFFLFAFSFFSVKTFAEGSQTDAFPLELEADLSAGTTAIYLLDFKSAEKHLQHAIDLQPEHPAAYFFLLMSTWYQLTYDSFLNRSPTLEEVFSERLESAVRQSKKLLKNKETRPIGYLYWGGTLGVKGWYHLTRGQWTRAYFSGKKGYSLLKKSLELNPELYDAHLGIGMYEYYAATLAPTLKALSSFAIRGNKEKALNHLWLAELKSRYVRTEASYFLWNAALEENRLEDAAEKVKVLNGFFPESPLFQWYKIQTLYSQKRWKEVIKNGEEFFLLASQGVQREDALNSYGLLISKVLYHSGMSALYLKNLELAKLYFDRTIDQPADFLGWKVLSYLRQGELFDLKEKRSNALEKYHAVLEFPPFWDSHKTARQRIKKPYRMEDEK